MTQIQPLIETQDLIINRPASCRVMVCQFNLQMTDWKKVDDDLYFPNNIEKIQSNLKIILAQANQSTVDIVVLPELSVPVECLPYVQSWSKTSGSIVVAGSHYYKTKKGNYINRSPIIIGGKIYFTEKYSPAPIEKSPIKGYGVTPGEKILFFKNSSIGNFVVLICSDYLNNDIKKLLPIEDIDIICVPAFQRKSSKYHSRMNIECEESKKGCYIAYSNMFCKELEGDGNSALFGVIHNDDLNKFKSHGFTDLNPNYKVCTLKENQLYMILELNLDNKKPFINRTVHDKSNIELVEISKSDELKYTEFVRKVAHNDERYVRIDDLFVPPNEYKSINDMLRKNKLLFLIGDPGIGKTYTAVKILKSYFNKGYEPIWYAGLEKSDRISQRQILENFHPRNKEIIYFEDPFGRTVFEKRDSIRRIFAPLCDHLLEVDSYVIITSRREIFEQFSKEVLPNLDINIFKEEMNVVKPSYSRDNLCTILFNLSVNTRWNYIPECKSFVFNKVKDGKLCTPLAIRDFVFSTENVVDIAKLAERLERRENEEKHLFAEDIKSCDVQAKLALSLIFLFGNQNISVLSEWFNHIALFLFPDHSFSGTAPFLREIRYQTGHRIEQYGNKAVILRFIHPFYEEAYAESSETDLGTFEILSTVAKFIARKKISTATSGILKLVEKYSNLTFKLFQNIIPIIKAQTTLLDIFNACLQLTRVYFKTSNESIIDLMMMITSPNKIIIKINNETDIQIIEKGLRLYYQLNIIPKFNMNEINSEEINWDSLMQKMTNESNFSTTIGSLSLIAKLNSGILKEYILANYKILIGKFKLLDFYNKFRFREICRVVAIDNELFNKFFADDEIKVKKNSYKKWMFENANLEVGIVIDSGALDAIKNSKSLLPVGVVSTLGTFERMEAVSVFTENGERKAIGITTYSSDEIEKIKGKHSSLIYETLNTFESPCILANHRILFMN